MKFDVKVGKDFHCYVAEEIPTPSLIVNLTNNAGALPPQAPSSSKRPRHWAIGAVIVFTVGPTLPATVYGVATGDFAPLASIAHVTRDLLEVSMKLLK
jgi:hypothetical protein